MANNLSVVATFHSQFRLPSRLNLFTRHQTTDIYLQVQ